MPWPMSQDYNEAVQNPAVCFADPELRPAEVVTNALGLPVPCSGNFADVYQLRAGDRRWAVKCFTRQIPGLKDRYVEVSKYLAQVPLPFMVAFQFLEQGIRVRGLWYPALKMDWVEGLALNAFVRDHLDKPLALEALCGVWLKLARRLREAQLAHCDLQHGNVLLVPGGKSGALSVKLVDYDGMCVPSLTLLKSIELGHPNYQHPQRAKEGAYGLEVDRFSHLVIYTALRALNASGRPLWEQYDNGDNLLFKQADFEAPGRSPLFQELLQSGDAQVRRLANALAQACGGPLDRTPLLDELVAENSTTPRQGKGAAAARPARQETASAESVFASATMTERDSPARARRRRKAPAALAAGATAVLLLAGLAGGGAYLALRAPAELGTNRAAVDAERGLVLHPVEPVALAAGESRKVAVRLERRGWDGPVQLRLVGLPAGVSARPATVAGGATGAELELSATPLAAGITQVRVVAAAGDTRAETPLTLSVVAGRPAVGIKAAAPSTPKEIVNSIGLRLALIPAGTFWMGTPLQEKGRRDDEIQHEVEITRPFYLGVFEVTQEEYGRVMRTNPSHFDRLSRSGSPLVKNLDTIRFPVDSVIWSEAAEFCRRLSELPEEKRAGRFYRLPTEAEWEYACRGGEHAKNSSRFHFGEELLVDQANFAGTALKRTTAVGSYPPNHFGLYDLHGNVWEWCGDWHGPYSAAFPQGPPEGVHRMLRGGCWMNSEDLCRSGFRGRNNLKERHDGTGFRVVCLEEAAQAKEPAVVKRPAPPLGGEPVVNSVGMRLVPIPPGKFKMGSDPDQKHRNKDEVSHEVGITRPFFMGAFEVTQEEYQRVVGKNPSFFWAAGKGANRTVGLDTSRFPVESVSWRDAVEFCRQLTALPAERAVRRVYRLPTEAEWEYACRGGSTRDSGYPYHVGIVLPPTTANFGRTLDRTAAVGSCAPNNFGLYDMHGNVWEWCSDWRGNYEVDVRQNPTGPANGTERIFRGGSWVHSAAECRSAYRNSVRHDFPGDQYGGFRVVCEVGAAGR